MRVHLTRFMTTNYIGSLFALPVPEMRNRCETRVLRREGGGKKVARVRSRG